MSEDPISTYGAQPWERLPKEGETEWLAFCAYRDSAYPDGLEGKPVTRSLRGLCTTWKVDYGQLLGIVQSWSWEDRCVRYDNEVAGRLQAQRMTHAQIVQLQHLRIGDRCREILEEQVVKLQARSRSGEELSAREIMLMREVGHKHDRLDAGMSTENVSVQVSLDLSKLSVEEIKLYRKLQEKAAVAVDTTSEPG